MECVLNNTIEIDKRKCILHPLQPLTYRNSLKHVMVKLDCHGQEAGVLVNQSILIESLILIQRVYGVRSSSGTPIAPRDITILPIWKIFPIGWKTTGVLAGRLRYLSGRKAYGIGDACELLHTLDSSHLAAYSQCKCTA